MKYPTVQKLSDIARIINAEFAGPPDFQVSGQNEIHVVRPGEIVFVDHPKYYEKALQSPASVVLINKKVDVPEGKALLIHSDPFDAFNQLTRYFYPFKPSNAMIDDSAVVGEGTVIQPGVFIGPEVTIGKNCLIHANVTITGHTQIGSNVELHSGTVIGSEAFYYKKRESGFDKLRTGGRVVIADDVELGSGTTVDRGVSGDTTIGKGTKIDNLCHIAHDTVVGERCLIAAHSSIAGCSVVEDEVTIWGRVGVKSDVVIGKGAEIFACSCVGRSLKPGGTYFGTPAKDSMETWREMAAVRKLAKE